MTATRRRVRRLAPRLTARYAPWFALPAFALITVFFYLPFGANVVLAFTRWTGYSAEVTFNGLENFVTLDSLGLLWHAVAVTVVFAATAMIVQNFVGLGLAKLLRQHGRVETFFRSVFFVPVLISPLAAGYIWAALLAPDGPINRAIATVVPGFDFYWLGGEVSALIVVAGIDAWKWSGLATLVYIAGLNRIPGSVIDAAKIDGAGPLRRFLGIELPQLTPAVTFNVVITLVSAFSSLDVILATTNGGPGDATSVLSSVVYAQYGAGYFGTASALSLVITALVIVVAIPLTMTLRRREVAL